MNYRRILAAIAFTPLILTAAACGNTESTPAAQSPQQTVTVTESQGANATGTADQPAPAGTPTSTNTAPTAGIPTKPSRDDANVDARDFQTAPGEYNFISPSGNVWCAIRTNSNAGETRFGCQARRSVPGSSGVTCRNTNSHEYAVKIQDGRVIQFCTTQGIFVAQNPRTLNYGQTIMVQGDSCTSTTEGITCYEGPGFIISRDQNKILP
ncbi:hypothetical protein GOEFS_115_00750 [Gordonia effusa NBRC 100432]|uniref:Lipoprotein n=1 Tax=Gordonia effusa NBRC 100432 TaxID=1077974 RepID=H0R5T4_9ACTN|nr:hypothetical protein GOEFS_115_00750 [Gordonia effusa NBRC 100432]